MSKANRNRIKHNKEKQLKNKERLIKSYYRCHLEEFAEHMLDAKLSKWQRFVLSRIRLKGVDNNE